VKKDRYLIVDDDEVIRESLAAYFEKYGIECDLAANAEEARHFLSNGQYDLLTVDVVMPGESGIELTKWIKAEFAHMPVILLTALDDAIDTVAGLEVGADDYVSKPFDFRVLLARAKAVLRRYEAEKPADTSSVKGVFDVKGRLLIIGEVEHRLNASEFAFVQALVAANGEPVSREVLFSQIFERDWNPEDRAVDNMVARLRHKIESTPETPKYVVTVRHKGYMIPPGVVEPVP